MFLIAAIDTNTYFWLTVNRHLDINTK